MIIPYYPISKYITDSAGEYTLNAIILAGGYGSRMIAEKQYIHKPLLPILGLPNIERTILMLNDFGIKEIFIIAGIYADQYTFLHEKYGCTIVSDPNCSVSTLYGIYSVINNIGNTFIIEGDVVLAENIFTNKSYSYYYVMKYLSPETDAWKPVLDSEGRVKSFEIGNFSEPCIFGVSFWSKSDAEIFKQIITDISTPENLLNSNNFWDDYFIDFLDLIKIYTLEISNYAATEMNNTTEYSMAIAMCQKYYSNPNQYFINLHQSRKQYTYVLDISQALNYTKKLLEDYSYKHPDEGLNLSIPSHFEDNEHPYVIRMGDATIGFIDLAMEKQFFLLRRIYIDVPYRRELLGTQILKNIITFSKLINKELRVNVYDDETVYFYKRLGFEKNYTNYTIRRK